VSLWYQTLVSALRGALPRWRWTGSLSHQGGSLNGRSQKDRLRVELRYARGVWQVQLWRIVDHDWALASEGQHRDVQALTDYIVEEINREA